MCQKIRGLWGFIMIIIKYDNFQILKDFCLGFYH
jgi:hypothetical protein